MKIKMYGRTKAFIVQRFVPFRLRGRQLKNYYLSCNCDCIHSSIEYNITSEASRVYYLRRILVTVHAVTGDSVSKHRSICLIKDR